MWKDGRKDAFGEPFSGLTRQVDDAFLNGHVCEKSCIGWMYIRNAGATVTSWRPTILGGEDVFFMPENVPWGKEVHGGAPFCWPWFGRREGSPKHGLARYLEWRRIMPPDKVYYPRDRAEFETESTPETMKIWPHEFRLRATVAYERRNTLVFTFKETNTGKEPFESAFGLHPYFAVADACQVALDGEPLPKPVVMKEIATGEGVHRLEDRVRGISYTIKAPGMDRWYVWNPGVERTPLCETLGPDEWKRFFCLEPHMGKPSLLEPGKSRTHTVRITVSKEKRAK